MTADEQESGEVCAHPVVINSRVEGLSGEGHWRDRWLCSSCQVEFVPKDIAGKRERARIVAWLRRDGPCPACCDKCAIACAAKVEAAYAIERGEHER